MPFFLNILGWIKLSPHLRGSKIQGVTFAVRERDVRICIILPRRYGVNTMY
jgi:hypothetical protein